MEGNGDGPEGPRLTVGESFHRAIATKTLAQKGHAGGGGPIMPHAAAGVIAMAVGDDGSFDPAPGVDVEISRRAVEAPVREG
jgi:hypothetical protein